MVKRIRFGWLSLVLILSMISAPWTLNAAATAKPAIVLAAFGTTTEAFDTYHHFELQVSQSVFRIMKSAGPSPPVKSGTRWPKRKAKSSMTYPRLYEN